MRTRRCVLAFALLVTCTLVFAPAFLADAADYVVVAGDTLAAIAKRLPGEGGHYSDIVALTNAKHDGDSSYAFIDNPNLIEVGWKLAIPTDAPELTAEEATNKAIALRFLEEVWNKGDMNVKDELLAASYIQHDPPNPDNDLEAHAQLMGTLRSAFPDLRFTLLDIITAGDRVVLRWTFDATHTGDLGAIAATGNTVKTYGTTILRFEDGKVAEEWVARCVPGLMLQLGFTLTPAE